MACATGGVTLSIEKSSESLLSSGNPHGYVRGRGLWVELLRRGGVNALGHEKDFRPEKLPRSTSLRESNAGRWLLEHINYFEG
jgi:hypothetical protein